MPCRSHTIRRRYSSVACCPDNTSRLWASPPVAIFNTASRCVYHCCPSRQPSTIISQAVFKLTRPSAQMLKVNSMSFTLEKHNICETHLAPMRERASNVNTTGWGLSTAESKTREKSARFRMAKSFFLAILNDSGLLSCMGKRIDQIQHFRI